MPTFAAPRPQMQEETPEVKAAWASLREMIEEEEVPVDGTITLNGVITNITGDPNNPEAPIWKDVINRKTGAKDKAAFLKVYTKLTDAGLDAITLTSEKKISFFDGNVQGRGERSPFRGFFYHVHRATTGEEPSPGLVNGTVEFDPADYVNRPVRVVLVYKGEVPADDRWYGTHANITVFVDSYLPPKRAKRAPRPVVEEEEEEDEAPFTPTPVTALPLGQHDPMARTRTGGKRKQPQQAPLPSEDDDELTLPE